MAAAAVGGWLALGGGWWMAGPEPLPGGATAVCLRSTQADMRREPARCPAAHAAAAGALHALDRSAARSSSPSLLIGPPSAARCIDSYVEVRSKEAEAGAGAAAPDPRLVAIVERLFERCYADQQYTQVCTAAHAASRLPLALLVWRRRCCCERWLRSHQRAAAVLSPSTLQAVGVALEARRLDQLERAITSSPGAPAA